MNEGERAIGARVRQIREEKRYSQREFAEILDLTRIQLAAVEYGQTPLKYITALKLFSNFGTNPLWLATGDGPIEMRVYLPSATAFKVNENALFSEVFLGELLALFKNEYPDRESEMELRYQRGQVTANQVKSWFVEFVPDGKVRQLEEELENFWKQFSKDFKSEDPKRKTQRQIWFRQMEQKIKAKTVSEFQKAQIFNLTDTETSAIDGGDMKKQLPSLLERLNRATKETGKMSTLADYLKVPLASVSRWLSGKREPGGETVLQLLKWVEQQERQK